jgi:hypothetical protein
MVSAVADVITVVYNFKYAVIFRRSDCSFNAAGLLVCGYR